MVVVIVAWCGDHLMELSFTQDHMVSLQRLLVSQSRGKFQPGIDHLYANRTHRTLIASLLLAYICSRCCLRWAHRLTGAESPMAVSINPR